MLCSGETSSHLLLLVLLLLLLLLLVWLCAAKRKGGKSKGANALRGQRRRPGRTCAWSCWQR